MDERIEESVMREELIMLTAAELGVDNCRPTDGFNDSFEVVGIHLVGGAIGPLYPGFFATETGLCTGGDLGQLAVQAIAAFVVLIYSFVVAFVLGFVIEKTIGLPIKNEDELAGIDTIVRGRLRHRALVAAREREPNGRHARRSSGLVLVH